MDGRIEVKIQFEDSDLVREINLSDGALVKSPALYTLFVIPAREVDRERQEAAAGRLYDRSRQTLRPDDLVCNVFGGDPRSLEDTWENLAVVDWPEASCHGVVVHTLS